MDYIIFDLEWNQPLYGGIRVTSPVYLEGEIIEIGAVKTNEECALLDTFKILITPQYYEKMNSNVSKLTGIRNKDLMLGIVFPDAFRAFMKWSGDDAIFFSWSNNDLRVLRENLRLFNMDPNDYLKHVYDLQQFFDKQILHEGRGCGLNEALEKVGEKGMEAHDALHDAINTFYVCKHLNFEEGFREYVTPQEAIDEGDALDVLEKNYPSINDSKRDRSLNRFQCKKCGRDVYCSPWTSSGKGKRISVAECECGEKFYLMIRYINLKDDKRKAIRIVYPGSSQLDSLYTDKAARQAERLAKRNMKQEQSHSL